MGEPLPWAGRSLELKLPEANLAAVSQLADYQLALGQQDKCICGSIEDCLTTERTPDVVINACEANGFTANEISWPLPQGSKAFMLFDRIIVYRWTSGKPQLEMVNLSFETGFAFHS